MGRKRRIRTNNPKFSKKHSTHPKLLKDDCVLETIIQASIETPKVEPAEEVIKVVEVKLPVIETPPVIEKPKPTRKKRTTAAKTKTTTRRTRAKKTKTKSE